MDSIEIIQIFVHSVFGIAEMECIVCSKERDLEVFHLKPQPVEHPAVPIHESRGMQTEMEQSPPQPGTSGTATVI